MNPVRVREKTASILSPCRLENQSTLHRHGATHVALSGETTVGRRGAGRELELTHQNNQSRFRHFPIVPVQRGAGTLAVLEGNQQALGTDDTQKQIRACRSPPL